MTTTETARVLTESIFEMESDIYAIIQYSTLLGVLTAGPDAETPMDGIHRVMQEIRDHGLALQNTFNAACEIIKKGAPCA
jgi:hypothetical protein